MNFSEALELVKQGRKVARTGWNASGMWIFLVPGSTFEVAADRPMGIVAPELVGREVRYRAHVDMRTADGEFVPWAATQSDLMVDDWVEVT
jgi:hypothetical protein